MGHRECEDLKYETEITKTYHQLHIRFALLVGGNALESRQSLQLFCCFFPHIPRIFYEYLNSVVGFHYLFYLVLIVFLT